MPAAETLATAEKKLNADLSAASNIAHRVGYEVVIKKIESYRVTHNGVKPITPQEGTSPRPQHLVGRSHRANIAVAVLAPICLFTAS